MTGRQSILLAAAADRVARQLRYLCEFFAWMEGRKLSEATRLLYCDHATSFLAWLGDRPLTPGCLPAYWEVVTCGRQPISLGPWRAALTQFRLWLIEMGHLPRDTPELPPIPGARAHRGRRERTV